MHGLRADRADPRRLAGPQSRVASFAADRSGGVAILFGLSIIVILLTMGAAIDYGRWVHARNVTQAAIDAAVLAGGRALQINPDDEAGALAAALKYYRENTQSRPNLETDTIHFKTEDNGLSITADGQAYIATTILALAGIQRMPLFELSGAEYSKALLATGANAETNLEISVMLDTSGSMNSNHKFEDMQAAASDLVNIIVWADQSTYTSKVALAPFSTDMRVPSTMLDAVRGAGHPATISSSYSCGRRSTCTATYALTSCVAERKGADKYTDAAPASGNFVMPIYSSGGHCAQPEENAILPLSNNKQAILDKIAGLESGGYTAGHLGTAWAWYNLSPNWNTALSSTASAYGAEKTKKIAILMTDGEYNTQYDAKGVKTGTTGAGSAVNDSSRAQAEALCDGMKAAGITVYTVGFDLGGQQSAIDTLEYCATDSSKFYNAANGSELKQAFRDIALKLSALYLTR